MMNISCMKWCLLTLCCFHNLLLTTADDRPGALAIVPADDQNDDATVEGEDDIQTSDWIDKSKPQFHPTDQWQNVQEGQAIPAGLHVRLNLETGSREAKLMEGDMGLKYLKTGKKDDMIHKNKRFKADELKRALKDFKTTKLDETDLEREEVVKSKFRSIDDLKKEIGRMDVTIKTDGQIVEELVTKLKNEDIQNDRLIEHLQDLEYYLHQFDNALVFKDYGGLEVIVKLLNTTSKEEVIMELVMVLGSASSSNPQVQISALEAGALHVMLKIMSSKTSNNVQRKVLFAISAMCRNFPQAQSRFLQLGGLSVLSQVFKESNAEKIQIKVVSLLNDLMVEKEAVLKFGNPDLSSEVAKIHQYNQVNFKESMLEQGWCELIPHLLTVTEHDSREQVLKVMTTLGENCTDMFVSSRATLHDLQKEYKQLSVEEKHTEEDEYFTHMLSLVEELMSLLKIKKEL